MSSLMNGGAESEVVIVIFCERSLPRAAAAGTFPNIGQYFRTMSSTNVPRTLVCELSLSSRELWPFPLRKILEAIGAPPLSTTVKSEMKRRSLYLNEFYRLTVALTHTVY